MAAAEYDWHPRLRRHAEALAARGDSVTALVLQVKGRPACEVVDGVRVVRLAVDKYRGASTLAYLWLYARFAAGAAVWLARRRGAFDVIHVNTLPEAMVFAAVLPKVCGVPVLLDVHDRAVELFGSKFGGRRFVRAALLMMERMSYRFASHVLTVHGAYEAKVRAVTTTPVTVVMNCPDERLFRARGWTGWDPAGEVVFGYHGLIARRHGLVEAVQALAMLRRSLPAVRLRLWGNGDGLAELRVLVAELGLTGIVDLPDSAVPVTDIAGALAGIHIGLVPSLRDPWTDGVLPTKLLEYAALGIPVITFRNPVIECFFPEHSVTFVDPVTPGRLAAAMELLACNPQRARGQAAFAHDAMQLLSWREEKTKYLDLIDRLAVAKRRPAR